MSPLLVLREAARTPIFWVLFGTFFVCGCSTNGLIQTHFITLCHDYGLPAVTAAERAGDDGHLRFHRHHRFRLAVRPLRQSLAAVLVLRPARAVAALSAVHRLHVLRPVAVRGVLRPRLDRHRAADGEAHRRPLRPRKGRHGVRLGFCRPPDRRRQRGVRRRPDAHAVRHLSAGVLRRRRAVHRRGAGDSHRAQVVRCDHRRGRTVAVPAR